MQLNNIKINNGNSYLTKKNVYFNVFNKGILNNIFLKNNYNDLLVLSVVYDFPEDHPWSQYNGEIQIVKQIEMNQINLIDKGGIVNNLSAANIQLSINNGTLNGFYDIPAISNNQITFPDNYIYGSNFKITNIHLGQITSQLTIYDYINAGRFSIYGGIGNKNNIISSAILNNMYIVDMAGFNFNIYDLNISSTDRTSIHYTATNNTIISNCKFFDIYSPKISITMYNQHDIKIDNITYKQCYSFCIDIENTNNCQITKIADSNYNNETNQYQYTNDCISINLYDNNNINISNIFVYDCGLYFNNNNSINIQNISANDLHIGFNNHNNIVSTGNVNIENINVNSLSLNKNNDTVSGKININSALINSYFYGDTFNFNDLNISNTIINGKCHLRIIDFNDVQKNKLTLQNVYINDTLISNINNVDDFISTKIQGIFITIDINANITNKTYNGHVIVYPNYNAYNCTFNSGLQLSNCENNIFENIIVTGLNTYNIKNITFNNISIYGGSIYGSYITDNGIANNVQCNQLEIYDKTYISNIDLLNSCNIFSTFNILNCNSATDINILSGSSSYYGDFYSCTYISNLNISCFTNRDIKMVCCNQIYNIQLYDSARCAISNCNILDTITIHSNAQLYCYKNSNIQNVTITNASNIQFYSCNILQNIDFIYDNPKYGLLIDYCSSVNNITLHNQAKISASSCGAITNVSINSGAILSCIKIQNIDTITVDSGGSLYIQSCSNINNIIEKDGAIITYIQ